MYFKKILLSLLRLVTNLNTNFSKQILLKKTRQSFLEDHWFCGLGIIFLRNKSPHHSVCLKFILPVCYWEEKLNGNLTFCCILQQTVVILFLFSSELGRFPTSQDSLQTEKNWSIMFCLNSSELAIKNIMT